jgi:hypothetical protein
LRLRRFVRRGGIEVVFEPGEEGFDCREVEGDVGRMLGIRLLMGAVRCGRMLGIRFLTGAVRRGRMLGIRFLTGAVRCGRMLGIRFLMGAVRRGRSARIAARST